jgi:hypothetical protein
MGSGECAIATGICRRVLIQFIAVALLVAMPLAKSVGADSSFPEYGVSNDKADACPASTATIDDCASGELTPMTMPPLGTPKDLEVTAPCRVPAGTYYYGNVNIFRKKGVTVGGTLTFDDATIDFWANNILVENLGTLRAGTAKEPIGTASLNNVVTIHLWGAEAADPMNGCGATCKTDPTAADGNTCGVAPADWATGLTNASSGDVKSCTSAKNIPGGVSDCFYAYKPLNFDGANPHAYFGYKTLGISWGGSLQLYGAKGASYDTATNTTPSSSGTSWRRLAVNLAGANSKGIGTETTITLDQPVNWKMNDKIVISSTDYMPAHAEQLVLSADANNSKTITVTTPVQYPHNGTTYPLTNRTSPLMNVPGRLGIDPTLLSNGVEDRAAVGLLSRSIRVVSGGITPGVDLPALPCTSQAMGCYFGGHTIARQGFQTYEVQGVEFYQMGEGGKIGHYPLHFHLARKTAGTSPAHNAFIKDSSIWDSMTRWIVVHGTQDVTLARNVGYESIGHGYYLEDATEINNKLYSNLGILARAAVVNAQNPRQVPGILAADFPNTQTVPIPLQLPQELVPYHSDIDHPSVFWMTNGWNDFEYNLADGAGSCGVCYWFVPAFNSGPSSKMAWSSYAAEQRDSSRKSTSPLQKFLGNYCSTAMNSFQTVGNTSPCLGYVNNTVATFPVQAAIHNPLAPQLPTQKNKADDPPLLPDQVKALSVYYPNVDTGGLRLATSCPAGKDCGSNADVPVCDAGSEQNCMITLIDHYTSSFTWSQFNFAALWLRPQWYWVVNSALTDIQGGGLSFVTGGGYTNADALPGHWTLASQDIFVGATQPTNPYALEGGPFNPTTAALPGPSSMLPAAPLGFKLSCALGAGNAFPGYCLDQNQGVSFPTSNFGNNQRFFNIYDGPSYEDSNAYLDIKKTTNLDCTASGTTSCNNGSQWLNARQLGTPRDDTVSGDNNCYLPNAAIAWKQPNGFYYPPAFHSKNLFFDNVDIRHYVIEPLFNPGTFQTNTTAIAAHYCSTASTMFDNFTDVDRQTELTDDDGSLTGFVQTTPVNGLVQTISVNLDQFFSAPVESVECLSGQFIDSTTTPVLPPGTAKTSPYDYVTTAMYPKCMARMPGTDVCNRLTNDKPPMLDPETIWNTGCSTNTCYGVPLYRQFVTDQEKNGPPMPAAVPTPSIRLMGQDQAQRSGLTVNNATYYIDTTLNAAAQITPPNTTTSNVFEKDHTYYTYFLFAKPNTKQTYQLYVGKDSTFDPTKDVQMVRANVTGFPYDFTQGAWPAQWGRAAADGGGNGYDATTGIETITVNMNGYSTFATDYATSKSNECAPDSFCKSVSGTCTCQLDSTDPNFAGCQSICTNWANKDVQCPAERCFGFSVTLPSDFATIPSTVVPRPQPTPDCFPSNFNISESAATMDLAGTCGGMTPPSYTMCK